MHETFFDLLRSPGHWAFEIFLTLLQDVLIVGLLWPFLRKHFKHHLARDKRDQMFGWWKGDESVVDDWSMNVKAMEAGHRPNNWDDTRFGNHGPEC